MVWDFGIFIGNMLSTMYPNTFMLAFIVVAMIATILIMIRSPAAFTIMVCFMTFALIAGGTIFAGIGASLTQISSVFMPLLILVVVLIGGAIAYAFWRIFGY